MNGAKLFGGAAVLMVAAAIVAGLFIAGAPSTQREMRFDDQRVSDLQQIASAVDLHTANTGTLPASLDELVRQETARLYYVRSITDPETGAAYEYTATGPMSYSLCATFTQSSEELPKGVNRPVMMDPYAQVWEHPAGYHCFDLVAPPKAVGTVCDVTSPCASGQTCAMLPGAERAVCVAQGWECLAAGCVNQTSCTIAESYPVQVRCTE